jgi:hypothetical protein
VARTAAFFRRQIVDRLLAKIDQVAPRAEERAEEIANTEHRIGRDERFANCAI